MNAPLASCEARIFEREGIWDLPTMATFQIVPTCDGQPLFVLLFPMNRKKRDWGAADLVQLVLASERVGGCVWELFGKLLWKQLTDE